MFDTLVTIVGNALNTPEWRRFEVSQTLMAKFKVAATSRRYDKESGRWVDGASLRVRVNCWRRLAENVAASVLAGDPVIVTGRLYTRDWQGEDGQRRVSYELDAVAVGHDLARGQGTFQRQRLNMSTTVLDDDRTDALVGGEATEPAEPPVEAVTLARHDGHQAPDSPRGSAIGRDDAFADANAAGGGLDPMAGDVDWAGADLGSWGGPSATDHGDAGDAPGDVGNASVGPSAQLADSGGPDGEGDDPVEDAGDGAEPGNADETGATWEVAASAPRRRRKARVAASV